MVEINNQRKASSCCGRRELITDGRKPGNHGYDVIVGGELFTDYPITLSQKLVYAKLKTQINRRRTLPASFLLVGCLPQAAWL